MKNKGLQNSVLLALGLSAARSGRPAGAADADITRPTDVIEVLPAGASTPSAEGVEHAIDNRTTKFLVFKAADGGFQIKPGRGARGGEIVTGLRIYTANDFVQRDPASYIVKGSASADGPFNVIAQGALSLPATRNNADLALTTSGLGKQTVTFADTTAYKYFRVLFPTNKGDTQSTQVGEVQLLGTVAGSEETPQTGDDFEVNSLSDNYDGICGVSDCTLREAIANSNLFDDANAIHFQSGLSGTLTLTRGELSITQELVITGPGAQIITIDGAGKSRIFNVSGSYVTLKNLTLSGGTAVGGAGIKTEADSLTLKGLVIQNCTANGGANANGAALSNRGFQASVSVQNTSIINNRGAEAIYNNPFTRFSLQNCTLSGNKNGNSETGRGGALSNYGRASVSFCTVAHNSAFKKCGGIFSDPTSQYAALSISNSIVASNTAPISPDIDGAVGSLGYNLIGLNGKNTTFSAKGDQFGSGTEPLEPGLVDLANNGGPTPTHALTASSPARDRGKSNLTAAPATTDQRGTARPVDDASIPNAQGGDGADIGAFEAAQSSPLLRFPSGNSS